MSDEPIGVGLVGCGDIAPAHAEALAAATGARLVGCMDVVQSSARSLGERYGVPWTTSIDDLLAWPGIEVVTIATPGLTHLPIARAAAQAHKHVLCEKPLATALPDADAMVEACKRNGVQLGTCFPMRYRGAVRWFTEIVRSGAIGEVFEIRLHDLSMKGESYWTGGYSGRTETDWRKHRDQSGGGVVITNLIHGIDLARAVTGLEVTRAYAEAGTFATAVEVEDLAVATLRYSNDAIGHLEASSCFVGGSVEAGFSILGTKGQIRSAPGGAGEAFFIEPTEAAPAGEWVSRDFDDHLHVDLYEDVARALRSGETMPATGQDGRAALEIVLAIYQSAESGRPVSLPLEGQRTAGAAPEGKQARHPQ